MTPLEDLELDAIKNPREVFGLHAENLEDALYAEDSIITVGITHQWTRSTDVIMLCTNNYTAIGEDFQVTATLAEAARPWMEVKP